jgi:hypothetical protein
MNRPSRCSLLQEEFLFGEHPRKPTIRNAWFGSNSETREGSVIVRARMSWYSVSPIVTLHGPITAREYVDRLGNLVHPMIQTLFPNNDAVFPDDNVPILTAGTVQLWLEEHESELQHLLLAE